MEYIRRTYGVPAKRGCWIEFSDDGEKHRGIIVGSRGPYLRVRIYSEAFIATLHPTWNIRYLTDDETKEAEMNQIMLLPPTLPTVLMSSILAIPAISVVKTKGAMVI
jgi:hypothetical protein